MCGMLLADLVAAHTAVRATRSRKAKVEALAEVVRRAGDEGDEVVAVAVLYLGGALRQRRTGLGWRGLQSLPQPADTSTLHVVEVDAAFETLSTVAGAGSKAVRDQQVADLFGRATAEEQLYLRGLVTGELRQGALDALVLDAVAAAAQVPAAAVRRAAMFAGTSAPVAVAALRDGERQAWPGSACEVGRRSGRCSPPARPTSSCARGTRRPGRAAAVAVDGKLDGIRIQVHRRRRRARVHPRASTRSPTGCPRWSSWSCGRCRRASWSSTGRRSRCDATAGPARSRRRRAGPRRSCDVDALRAARAAHARTSSTCCTSTANDLLDEPRRGAGAVLAGARAAAAARPARR